MDTKRSISHRFQHEEISSKISEIENLFSSSNIKIHTTHQLSSLLNDARDIAVEWAKENISETDINKLFSVLHVERIYSSIQYLDSVPNKEKYLKDLLNGTLNFLEKDSSHAKSIQWELEVFTKIKKVIPTTYLEEPDVLVNFDQLSIALPCKKIFSENGVPKVLSNAVSQIEREHEFGIVAMNIDDLIPEGVLLNQRTFKEAGDILHSKNMSFLKRQERHFLKYLSNSRIIAVLVSTSMITAIEDESPKLNNFSQWAIWTTPTLKPAHKKAIDMFQQMVIG
jgi:hypothetical protein